MRKPVLALLATMAVVPSFAAVSANAATVPCEDMQKQLETALKTNKPLDADKAKFDELKAKGDERCKSEDDRRADTFYTDALAILGK
jgi:hypothetical protein